MILSKYMKSRTPLILFCPSNAMKRHPPMKLKTQEELKSPQKGTQSARIRRGVYCKIPKYDVCIR